MEEMRLQKYMAACGLASRRKSEELIAQGKVYVNGKVVTEPGVKVSDKDTVTVDGKTLKPEKKKYYIMINKPKGVLCSVSDDRERTCVVDLVEGVPARLFPVGRLDYDTEGLLILTNDGDFMQKMTHPSFEIWKTYEAQVRGVPDKNDEMRFREGILLEGETRKTLPAFLSVTKKDGKGNATAEIIIKEGRNRQVRRMMEALGHPVRSLKRVRISFLELGDLKPGQWRYLTDREVASLSGKEQKKDAGKEFYDGAEE